jgi:hypothetical protein
MSEWSAGPALVWTLVVSLLRIDGPVYAGALLAAFLVTAGPDRRAILRAVIIPAAAVLAAYHSWRIWYFGDVLPAPVYSKVLYKLTPWKHLIAKAPRQNYVLGFLKDDGGAVLVLLAAGGLVRRPNRTTAALGLAAAAATLYVGVVGDWMFGSRFFVALVPLFALLASVTIARIARWRRAAAWAAAAACVISYGKVATTFESRYVTVAKRESWLMHPTLDPGRFFTPYWAFYDEVRRYVRPGDLIAYDQAGFVPYMLDVENIDYLGICSRFFAQLPTSDVFFTEVGRYTPLTNATAYSSGQAYLLARSPRLVLAGTGLLRSANGGVVPREILGGHYRLLFVASDETQAAYVRTDLSTEAFRRESRRYLENFAHPSHVAYASIDGTPLPPSAYAEMLPYLYQSIKGVIVTRSVSVDLKLSTRGAPIYGVYLGHVEADRRVTLEISLWAADGRRTYLRTLDLTPGRPQSLQDELEGPVDASRVTLRFAGPPGETARVRIYDLRVQGQSPELAAYVSRFLALRPVRPR